MKGLKVLTMVLAGALIIGAFAQDIFADTRTLTTTLIVTIRPKTPEAPNAPEQVQDLLSSALARTQNQQYVKLDMPSEGVAQGQRYTLMERL